MLYHQFEYVSIASLLGAIANLVITLRLSVRSSVNKKQRGSYRKIWFENSYSIKYLDILPIFGENRIKEQVFYMMTHVHVHDGRH